MSSSGSDGCVNEMWKEVSLPLVGHIAHEFRKRATAIDDDREPYFGIMKTRSAIKLAEYRLLGKQSTL
eukprot:371400-Karenia_brevis.AAC.1